MTSLAPAPLTYNAFDLTPYSPVWPGSGSEAERLQIMQKNNSCHPNSGCMCHGSTAEDNKFEEMRKMKGNYKPHIGCMCDPNWKNVDKYKPWSAVRTTGAEALAEKFGLQYSTVAWEDSGRTKNSVFGPNISDMTLSVHGVDQPIIRRPNFSDLTSDQSIDAFSVNVGNENGSALRSIPLKEYIQNITKYTDIKLKGSLLASRDTEVLTSAQACILPGNTEFGVRLYNHQSTREPAVLVIIASAHGTSAHFVRSLDNKLSFNKNGLMAQFVAERLVADRERRGVAAEGTLTAEEKLRNALLIFQIPLKYIERPPGARRMVSASFGVSKEVAGPTLGMDHALISTTEGSGTYPKLDGWTVERDDRMPIRCTIQYYHISDGEITERDMAIIAEEVSRHKPIGSLVSPSEKTSRVTEHTVGDSFIGRLFSGL